MRLAAKTTVAGAGNCSAFSSDAEREALLALFSATDGAQWVNATGWGQVSDHCGWFGVTCDDCGRVSRLRLVENGLVGTLPAAAMTALEQLSVFSVGSNGALSGTLGPELARLSQLWQLSVMGTGISGSLDPALSAWTRLRALNLAWTSISGTLAPSFSQWPAEILYLYNTQLSGTLHESFAAWTALRWLHLMSTAVSGTLSPAFSAWSQLEVIYTVRSAVSGTLDPSLSTWTNLQYLYISQSPISGTLRYGPPARGLRLTFCRAARPFRHGARSASSSRRNRSFLGRCRPS